MRMVLESAGAPREGDIARHGDVGQVLDACAASFCKDHDFTIIANHCAKRFHQVQCRLSLTINGASGVMAGAAEKRPIRGKTSVSQCA